MVDSKQQWKAWLYLAPDLILLLIFTVWPIFSTVRMAFLNGYKVGLDGPFEFGIENFLTVIKLPAFIVSLKNTILLTLFTVPLSTIIALLIAVCLNSIKPLNKLLQTIYFLPYVTNSIAIGMVFNALFNVINVGGMDGLNNLPVTQSIFNQFLQIFGVDPINWINKGSDTLLFHNAVEPIYFTLLGEEVGFVLINNNFLVMVIYIVWNALPFKILILLGGLQSVNIQYYDAAKIDGTSRARTLWRITVPMLSPMIAYVVITGFIGGFKEYSSIIGVIGDSMTTGGTPGSMSTMVGLIYQYISGNQGQAAAGALLLFVIIFIVTLINLYVSKKKVHY